MMRAFNRIRIAATSLVIAATLTAYAEPVPQEDTSPMSTLPALLNVQKIWDKAPHNAFTDLIRYHDTWVCAFREAPAHTGGVQDSRIRILTSDDGSTWTSVAALADDRGDIRDAKLAVTPDGQLMLLTAIQLFDRSTQSHQSLVWFTRDLKQWDGPIDVGEPSIWLWGITWHKGVGYSIGYSTGKERFARLYRTRDGRQFETWVDRLAVDAVYPNESAIVFDDHDIAHVLLRCDPVDAFLGQATPPYDKWTWRQLNGRVGGPALTITPDGHLLGAGRLYDDRIRTALFWIDPDTARLAECLPLPSGGDTSYPGLVWHDGHLHMSYYDSREGKSSIYLATIKVPASQ